MTLGAFLEGAIEGAQLRRSWNRQDKNDAAREEDRKRRHEHQDWARDRTERLDEENAEDRRRRRKAQDSNSQWAEYQRTRQREADARSDAERDAFADAYAATEEDAAQDAAPQPPARSRLSLPGVEPSAPSSGPALSFPDQPPSRALPAPNAPTGPAGDDLMVDVPDMQAPVPTPVPASMPAPAPGIPQTTAPRGLPAPPAPGQPPSLPPGQAPVIPNAAPDAPAPAPAPDGLPQIENRSAKRFQEAVAKGSAALTPRLAAEADAAAAVLQSGVNPQNGAALNAYEIQELEQVVQAAEQRLGATPTGSPSVAGGAMSAARANDMMQGQANYAARTDPPALPGPAAGPTPGPAPQQLPGPAGADTAPVDPATADPERFTRHAAANPGGGLTFKEARGAEIAERALQSGINPVTKEPMTDQDRVTAQRIIDRASSKMNQPPAAVPNPPFRSRRGGGQGADVPPGAAMAAEAPVSAAPAQTPAETAASDNPAALDAAVEASAAQPTPPSVQDAVQAMPRTQGLPLSTAPKKELNRRAKTARSSVMDRYAKVGAPKMVEYYLKAGEPEKAAAFQAFIDKTQTKAAMGHWADAVFAATIGNDEMFLDGLTKSYNARGYFDDGYEAVRDKSGILRDVNGNVTGAQITFKDTSTGRIYTQTLDSSEDLYQMGVHMLAPEQVFEHGWNRVKQAEARRASIMEYARRQNLKLNASDQERLQDALKMLSDNAGIEFDQLPMEEKIARAWAEVQRFDGSGNLKGGRGLPGQAGQPASQPAERVVPRF